MEYRNRRNSGKKEKKRCKFDTPQHTDTLGSLIWFDTDTSIKKMAGLN